MITKEEEEDEETDYEDVDNEGTSLTQITSQVSSSDSVTSPDSVTSSVTDSVFVTSPTFVTSTDCATSERELLTCSEICSTPVLISPGEITISLEL